MTDEKQANDGQQSDKEKDKPTGVKNENKTMEAVGVVNVGKFLRVESK